MKWIKVIVTVVVSVAPAKDTTTVTMALIHFISNRLLKTYLLNDGKDTTPRTQSQDSRHLPSKPSVTAPERSVAYIRLHSSQGISTQSIEFNRMKKPNPTEPDCSKPEI
jgi:hypothetical protein